MTSPHKPLSQFHPNFTGMFLWWSPLKIVQRILFHAELWLPWHPKEKNLKYLLLKKTKELELRYFA
jgi:hypothetical protein